MLLESLDDNEAIFDKKKERIRRFFNKQLFKLKMVAGIGSLILLELNLTFAIMNYYSIEADLMIPVIFFCMCLVTLGLAHTYLLVFNMYRTEAEAERYFKPYLVSHIGPFEEMTYRYLWLPVFEAVINLQEVPQEKQKLERRLKKFQEWVKMGYIPKSDMPRHLKKFYLTKKEGRL